MPHFLSNLSFLKTYCDIITQLIPHGGIILWAIKFWKKMVIWQGIPSLMSHNQSEFCKKWDSEQNLENYIIRKYCKIILIYLKCMLVCQNLWCLLAIDKIQCPIQGPPRPYHGNQSYLFLTCILPCPEPGSM